MLIRTRKPARVSRRRFLGTGLGAGALGALGLSRPRLLAQSAPVMEVDITNNYRIGRWFFNPVGIHVQPGQTVRWISRKWGGSATAFHPSNDNHELRIPEGAQPFNSGVLTQGETDTARFEWIFEQEGTYDYFSLHHEKLGAVGRIVVGSPGGPASNPPGYGASQGRAPMFATSKKVLEWLTPERIMKEQTVRYPQDLIELRFPLGES